MAKQSQAFFFTDAEIMYKDKIQTAAQKKAAKKPGSKKSSSSSKVHWDCSKCELNEKCRHPKIQRYGKGEKGIMIIDEFPDGPSDQSGVPMDGPSGKLVAQILSAMDIDIDRDCWTTYAVRCKTPRSRKGQRGQRDPKDTEVKSCLPLLLKDIEECQPKLILCLGQLSLKNLITSKAFTKRREIEKLHGWAFPIHERNAWVGGVFHPAYVGWKNISEDNIIDDIYGIMRHLDIPLPQPLTMEGNHAITDSAEAIAVLERFDRSSIPVAFDYETNDTSPYYPHSKLLTVSLANKVEEGYCLWLANPEWNEIEQTFVWDALKKFLLGSAPKVIQNSMMEECWGRELVGAAMNNLYMDTMVTSHVINCRKGTTSLDLQIYKMVGHYYSGMVNVKKMAEEPFPVVSDYNCLDSRYTLMLQQQHDKFLNNLKNADLKGFNKFYMGCVQTMADLRERGILIDVKQMDVFDEEWAAKRDDQSKALTECKAGVKYRAIHGQDININSSDHLCDLFFKMYQNKVYKRTKKKNPSVDADVLERIRDHTRDQEVAAAASIILKKKKASSFLRKIKEYRGLMGSGGRLHPTYNLNIAETFRSSSREPNAQNMFKHDAELYVFRKLVIPRPGNVILEVDYDGLEMRVAAMVSGDPELARQIKEDIDTHYRWAGRLYEKDISEITDDERFQAKNSFVFATLYGSLPEAIAANMKLPLEHVTRVWHLFWEEYHFIKEWQEKTMADYKKNGYVSAASGFRRPAPLTVEKIFNTPIQGPAFHLLLDGMVKFNDELKWKDYKSFLYSEIHDSIEIDTAPDEVEDVMKVGTEILCSKRFDFQRDIPLSVSWEIGETFYKLEKI